MQVFAKEACLFKTFPSLFITQLLVIFFGSAAVCLGYNEVLFVARETTLTNVMKMRYVAKPPPPAKQQANVITFLRTGQFRVTYPKVEDDVSQRQRKKQCRHHDDEGHDHSHDHVHDSQDRPEASLDQPDQTVRNLLAQIESDMGIRPRATSQQQQGMENERTERGRSMSVKIVPTSTPSRRPSNASVIYSNDIESAPEYSHHRDGGVERHGAEEGQEDMEGDADDDYDMEFVNSEANLYDRFYWQETDAPLEAEAQSLLRSA